MTSCATSWTVPSVEASRARVTTSSTHISREEHTFEDMGVGTVAKWNKEQTNHMPRTN